MSFDPQLWIAMAAAALFYHYANFRKASTQAYTFASVVVSTLCMLTPNAGWLGLILAQSALFLAVKLRERNKP